MIVTGLDWQIEAEKNLYENVTAGSDTDGTAVTDDSDCDRLPSDRPSMYVINKCIVLTLYLHYGTLTRVLYMHVYHKWAVINRYESYMARTLLVA